MTHHLVIKEQTAIRYMNEKTFAEAASLFSEIVAECPQWEHGLGFYSLACCLEELGQLNEACANFKRALEQGPFNPYFLGGYASFHYLHGDPRESYDTYLKLIRENHTRSEIDSIYPALKVLADKLMLPEGTIEQDLASIVVQEE